MIDPVLASGILGLAEKPQMLLSGALEAYWSMPLEEIEGKSEDQMRR